jgi:hypothetical protein
MSFTTQSTESNFLTGGVVTANRKIRFDDLNLEFFYDGKPDLSTITPETKFFFFEDAGCGKIPLPSFDVSSITDPLYFYIRGGINEGDFMIVYNK